MSKDLVAAIDTAPAPPGGAPGKRTPGRAGRDLPAAIGVGVGLGGLVLATLHSPWRWGFVVVVAAAVALGVHEVVQALRRLGARPPKAPLVVGGTVMVTLAYTGGADALVADLPASLLPETIVTELVHADVRVRGIAVGGGTLEDLFVALTGEGFDVAA